MHSRKTGIAIFLAALFTPAAHAADEAQRLEALDAACYKAREGKLREVQRQKIEECVRQPPPPREAAKTRQDCEKYWGNYGWVQGTVSGAARPHLFTDLPECVQAFEARKKHDGR